MYNRLKHETNELHHNGFVCNTILWAPLFSLHFYLTLVIIIPFIIIVLYFHRFGYKF